MGLDSLSPVAPARIRCLLLPVGRITASRFWGFVDRLQQQTKIRLGDVSPHTDRDRTMFSPLAFPSGSIVLDLLTSNPTATQLSLTPFELYREPLVTLGIADGFQNTPSPANGISGNQGVSTHDSSEEPDGVSSADIQQYREEVAWLRENYSTALVHLVLVFDCNGKSLDPSEGVVLVPPLEKSRSTTMKTIMCDLAALLLDEMTSYAKSLQALPSIETPSLPHENSALHDRQSRPESQGSDTQRPSSRLSGHPRPFSPSPARGDGERNPNRASLPAHTPSPFSAAFGSASGRSSPTTMEISPTPATNFDDMGSSSSARGRPMSISLERPLQGSTERISTQGFGSGTIGERMRNKAKGRLAVVIGSMYLLAGRWPDAIREMSEGAALAKNCNDHVWHAKALDYILVTLLMFSWAGMDFDIPGVCYPLYERVNAVTKSARHTPTGSGVDGASTDAGKPGNSASLAAFCALLPDLVNHILHLYVRAATFTTDYTPQISFSETAIRLAKLLAFIQASNAVLSDQCLDTIVLGTPFQAADPETSGRREPFISKVDISSILFRALPTPGLERSIEPPDRLNLLTGIASVLATIGYHRKKAFILRELLSLLLPALVQSRKDSAAELGFHPAASLSSLDVRVGDIEHGAGSRLDGYEQGIQSFLIMICEVYGVVSESVPPNSQPPETLPPSDSISSDSEIVGQILRQSIKRSFGNQVLKLDILRSCINICEALPDLQGVLLFSGWLLRTASTGLAPGQKSTHAYPAIPMEDQIRLASNMSRTATAIRQMGYQNIEGEYWDEFLLRDVVLVGPPASDLPVRRQRAELELAAKGEAESKTGPFIYNPFTSKPAKATHEPMLLVNERAIIILLIQNLYDIDLEIEHIRLETKDSVLEAFAQNVVISPYRTQKLQLSGVALSVGRGVIIGCTAKIRGCQERYFPIFKQAWKGAEEPKIKRLGLSAAFEPKERPLSTGSDLEGQHTSFILPKPNTITVGFNVVEAQPLLILRQMRLPQSSLMILEGERKTFQFTLENASSIEIDFLVISFLDSTTEIFQTAVSNKDISSAQLYEAEYYAYKREAFRLVGNTNIADLTIPSRGQATFEIEVFGKPGLTHGDIQITYGHLGVPKSEVGDHFYTRQLVVPVSVTVNASVELIQNDFLPLMGDFAWRNKNKKDSGVFEESSLKSPAERTSNEANSRFQKLFNRLGTEPENDDHCLLLLDFRNMWPKALSISLEVRESTTKGRPQDDGWRRAYTVHETIQPGCTCRVLVVLPRLLVEDPEAAIPPLNPSNKRQFVLSMNAPSAAFEKANREVFWYREEVLKYLRAEWKDSISGRHGMVDLRNMRLTLRMVEAIKRDDVSLEMRLLPCTPSPSDRSPGAGGDDDDDKNDRDRTKNSSTVVAVRQTGHSLFSTTTDAFLTLAVRITNNLPHQLHVLLRLQPSMRDQTYGIALDLAKRVGFNGVLQRAVPRLGAHESREISMGMVFMANGEYEIGASVEEIKAWRPPPEQQPPQSPPAQPAQPSPPALPLSASDELTTTTATATATAPALAGKEPEPAARPRAATGSLDLHGLLRPERRIWYARTPCMIDVGDKVASDRASSDDEESDDGL